MINFIKNLLGFGAKETVQEILTPPAKVEVAPAVSNYTAPAKPTNKKVRAISVPATPNNTKPKAKPTEGKTKGGNNVVKQQPKQAAKPQAPKPGKSKAKRK